MPKMKTKRGAAKRFKVTGSGRVKRSGAYKRHLLTNKSRKRKRRHKKLLKLAKGVIGGRKNYRQARSTVEKALVYAYRDRKARKRDFRSLWIVRINAAARDNGITYRGL